MQLRVLDARGFGLPQRRRRLWVVGERGRSARGPAKVLAVHAGEGGDPAAAGKAWKTAPRRVEEGAGDLKDSDDVDWSLADSWLRARETETAMPTESQPEAVTYAADMRHGTLSAEAPTIQVGPSSGWSLHANSLCGPAAGAGAARPAFQPARVSQAPRI